MVLRFINNIMGIYKKGSNFGVMCEVCRGPHLLDYFKTVIEYWSRLENSASELLQDA